MLEWNDGQVETLKTMWQGGSSASEITRALGVNATRNAVIGKVHRLKLDRRVTVSARAAKPTAPVVRREHPAAPPPRPARPHGNKGQPKAAAIQHRLTMAEANPPVPMPVPKGLPDIADRLRLSDIGAHQCKWCEGDPLTTDHSFCGTPVKGGGSWCSDHHARVFLQR